MVESLKAACVQMTSGPDIEDNLKQAETLIREAAGQGVSFIVTPEVTDQILPKGAQRVETALTQDAHPGVPFFSGLAQDLGVTLVIGSMLVKTGPDKIANRSFLFAPDGTLRAVYDKIHLYDVDLPTGESWRESKVFTPGNKAVVAGNVGLSICYDVRFGHLYRDLAKRGAQIITVPAAFTVPTGQAHWSVLLRARAIECGSFILAAAQCGDHNGARQTYGHSMIVGPWGEVMAEAGHAPGIIMADLNLAAVQKARAAIPSLQHDREYAF